MCGLIPEFTVPYSPGAVDGSVTVQGSPQSRLPTMLVRRDRKKIGSYLISHRLLTVEREEDRQVAADALTLAGFDVLPPLEECAPGDGLLRLTANVIGAWGNVLVFELRFPSPRNSPRVALYDLDNRSLCVVSGVLVPHVRRALALMGLKPATTEPAALPIKLRDKLEWQHELWGWSQIHDGPAFGPDAERGDSITRSLMPEAAARVPEDVARAVNEIFAVPVKDPFIVMDTPLEYSETEGFWSYQHGVLGRSNLAKLRAVASRRVVSMPGDWREHWDSAMALSPSHAPALTALSLHDEHPEWWGRLKTEGAREQLHGVWLLGHNDKKPEWVRTDMSGVEEDRFGAAVAAVVTMVKDLDWLVPTSLIPQDCALCGRPFTPSKLAAGHVAQLRTAKVCHLCVRTWGEALDQTNAAVLEAGATSAVSEVVRYAGRVISASMVPGLFADGTVEPITAILLRQVLPTGSEGGWVKWLARAGVLGEGWRPSRGYISVAADGHECRSAFERIIDDYLWAKGIPHETEPIYPYDAELNANGSRADWRLPDGTFVEAAGMMSQVEYAAKMARKAELAAKHGIRLLVLTESDLPRLYEVFEVTRTGG